MKKKVKHYGQQIQDGTLDRRHVLKDFSRMLDNQVCGSSMLVYEYYNGEYVYVPQHSQSHLESISASVFLFYFIIIDNLCPCYNPLGHSL